jgi:hypothetical protein
LGSPRFAASAALIRAWLVTHNHKESQSMQRVSLGVLALCTVAAAFAAVASSAFATELAEFSVLTSVQAPLQTVTSTFETPSAFEGKLTSVELSSTQTATSRKEGTVNIKFLKTRCETVLFGNGTGTTPGQSAGTVQSTGTYQIVDSNKILLDIAATKVNCEGTSPEVKLSVEGTVLGTLSPEAKKTKVLELTVKGKKGKEEPAEYENNSGTKVRTSLLTTNNITESPTASDQNESKAVMLETERETELS